MTTHINIDPWSFWRAALASGTKVEFVRGEPRQGFYKVRSRDTTTRAVRWDAVAIWREADGELCCARTGPRPAPTHADEIEELFASCTSTPISHELYQHIAGGGEWPEDVAKAAEPAPDLPPHEALAVELAAQQRAAKEWLTALGHKPATQEEADKSANFANEFARIGKKAEGLRVAEKEPFLEGGRLVDAKFKPTIDGATVATKWAKGLSDDYAKAENARRAEEARVANEKALGEFEERKRDAELADKGVQVPQFAPPVEPPKPIVADPVKVGTTGRRQSLVKTESWEIESIAELLRFLATRNNHSADFLEKARAEGRALCKSGVVVAGMKLMTREEMR